MAVITNKSKNGSIIVSTEVLSDLEKRYKLFTEGDGLEKAAKHISEIAFNKMKAQYMATKSNSFSRRRKYRRKSLEDKLFSGGAPVVFKKGNNKYEFSLVPKDIERSFPHFKWQERGTKKMVDTQPYIKIPGGKKGLRAITKEEARSIPKIRRNFTDKKTGRFTRDIGRVHYIKVPHPGIIARNFILTANLYLKTEAEIDATNYIRDRLKGK